MKFSVFTVGMPEYSVKEGIIKLNEIGYDGIELRVCDIPDDIKRNQVSHSYWGNNKCTVELKEIEEKSLEIYDLCKNNNVEICALTTYLSTAQVDEIEKVMRAAKTMNCPRIRVWVASYDGKINYNLLLEQSVKELKVIESLSKKYNVKATIEMHMGNIVPSASAAYRLVSNFDSKYIGVIYDTGNMVHEGFEQYKMGLEILGEYLDHIHIKNAKNVIKETDDYGVTKWETQWTSLKNGQIDFNKFMNVLKEINYNGYLSFEDFSNEMNTEEKLKSNIEYIKKLI